MCFLARLKLSFPSYLSNTLTNLCMALYCILLYCVVLNRIVLSTYCYVDIIQYSAMHKFVGVLDNLPFLPSVISSFKGGRGCRGTLPRSATGTVFWKVMGSSLAGARLRKFFFRAFRRENASPLFAPNHVTKSTSHTIPMLEV